MDMKLCYCIKEELDEVIYHLTRYCYCIFSIPEQYLLLWKGHEDVVIAYLPIVGSDVVPLQSGVGNGLPLQHPRL